MKGGPSEGVGWHVEEAPVGPAICLPATDVVNSSSSVLGGRPPEITGRR